MRNCFLAITVMLAAGAGLVACSDDGSSSSPLQPSPLTPAPAGAGPRGFAGGPAAGLAAGADAEIARLAPVSDDFNAYNAQIEYVDGEVTITFVPVDMSRMPPAAGAHRNRAVTVRHCPVEPHHVGQVCGDGAPVFRDSFAFMGSPSRTFTMPGCSGWLVIEVAELSDDRYDGWRNAPLSCRTDEAGRAVASVDTDGNGDGWGGSRFDPPARAESEAEQVQRVVDEAIAAAAGRFVPAADPVSVSVTELFEDTAGTTGDDYRATSSNPAVATVEITPNPRVKITPVGPGRTTIRVDNLRSEERVDFDVAVEEPGSGGTGSGGTGSGEPGSGGTGSGEPGSGGTGSGEPGSGGTGSGEPGNNAPTVTNPGNKTYAQGEEIEAFSIGRSDADGDDVTVAVSGLPAGLAWSDGMVSGTVAADAEARVYTVTVTASDGVATATATFTITVMVATSEPDPANDPPEITNPGNKEYRQRETIEAFSIEASDPDGDDVTVGVSGLPTGLAWSDGMVSGTVAWTVATRAYPVTVTASDGAASATATFTITVTSADSGPPVITDPGAMSFYPGETITAFPVTATDPDESQTVTVTVTDLPTGLTWSGGMVSGTVDSAAAGTGYPVSRDFTVNVEATDGVNEPVTASFTIKVITTWVLLIDSFDATDRGNHCGFSLGLSGSGPDDGGWATRWVRWYYDAGDRTRTITQAYNSGGFAGGGSSARGCTYTANCSTAIYTGTRRPNETDYTTGGAQVLTPRDHANSRLAVRRLDSMGNEITRVPAGRAHTTDTNLNVWTVSFTRSSAHTIYTTRCNNNANWGGEIYYMNVPMPPSP